MTQVRVKDFGPIAEASIELKPLTMFIGPNGIGKSYLALAIYCLANILEPNPVSRRSPNLVSQIGMGTAVSLQLLKKTASGKVTIWPTEMVPPFSAMRVKDLPEQLREIIEAASDEFAGQLTRKLGEEIERCYGVEIGGLVRRGGILSRAQLEVEISDEATGFRWSMRLNESTFVKTQWTNDLHSKAVDPGIIGFLASDIDLSEHPEVMFQHIFRNEFPSPSLPDMGKPHYMPASRSGILLGHKAFVNSMVAQLPYAWVKPISSPTLAGHIADLIQALLAIKPVNKTDAKLMRVIAYLQDNVAHGSIEIDTTAAYPEVSYINESGKFQLHQVHSAVSETAPMLLFLKYLVESGHLFIIEEPEAHLDAESQRTLASVIAMLVNAGVKVLITTHSDFFVNQMSNLLMVSQVGSDDPAACEFTEEQVLVPEMVGAYVFRRTPEGSIVENLQVTGELGIPVEHFTDVHAAIYDQAIALEQAAE